MLKKQVKSANAMQFIYLDETEQGFKISTEAEEFLRSLDPTIELGICCVVGKYRTGKSYIINKGIIQNQNVFQVGNTVNSCTKGLWLYDKILEAENNTKYLVIDTEGLGSCEETAQVDTQIFLLGLLMSSFLIYNSKGHLDENTVNDMAMFVNVARDLHSKQITQKRKSNVGRMSMMPVSGQGQDEFEFANNLPHFLWIVRDFSLKLVDKEGNKINSKEYLERALEPQKGNSQHIEYKNRMKKLFKTFFKERDCLPMVRPLEEEKDLQNLSNVQDSQLRPEFMEQLKNLRNRLNKKIQPKVVSGQKINGPMIMNLAINYVQSINQGGMPNIDYVWNQVAKSYQQQILDDLINGAQQRLNDVKNDEQLLMNRKYLKELKSQIQKECESKIRQNTASWSDVQLQQMIEKISAGIQNTYQQVKKHSEDMKMEIEDRLRNNEYDDYEKFKDDYVRLKMEFVGNDQMEGDKEERLQYFLKNGQNLLMMGGDIICCKVKMKMEKQQKTWDDKSGQMEQMHKDKIKRLERENESLQDQLEHLKIENKESNKQAETLQSQVDGEIKELQTKMQKYKDQLQDQRQQNEQLYSKCQELQREKQEKMQQIEDNNMKNNQQMNQQILDLNIQILELGKQKELVEKQSELIQSELKRSQESGYQKDQQIKELSGQLQKHEVSMTHQIKEQSNVRDDIQRQLDQLKTENNKLNQKLKQSEKKVKTQDGMEKEVKQLRNKIQQKNNIEDSLMNFFQKIGAANNLIGIEKYKEIQDANGMLNNALKTLEQRNEELQDKIKNLKSYKKVINFCSQFKCSLCNQLYDNIVIVTHIQLCLQQYQQKFLGKQLMEYEQNSLKNINMNSPTKNVNMNMDDRHQRSNNAYDTVQQFSQFNNLLNECESPAEKVKQKDVQDSILKKILNFNINQDEISEYQLEKQSNQNQVQIKKQILTPDSRVNQKNNFLEMFQEKEQKKDEGQYQQKQQSHYHQQQQQNGNNNNNNDQLNININIDQNQQKQVYSFSQNIPKELQQVENMKISIYQANIKEDKMKKSYTEYMIYCQMNNRNWIVRRKFMDFCNLNKGLKDLYGEQYTKYFKFEEEFESDEVLINVMKKKNQNLVDQRREKLQSYLKALSKLEMFQDSEIFQIFINQNQRVNQSINSSEINYQDKLSEQSKPYSQQVEKIMKKNKRNNSKETLYEVQRKSIEK